MNDYFVSPVPTQRILTVMCHYFFVNWTSWMAARSSFYRHLLEVVGTMPIRLTQVDEKGNVNTYSYLDGISAWQTEQYLNLLLFRDVGILRDLSK